MKYIGLFSGGKDSLTSCHHMWNKGSLNEVLYCKTGIGLDENINYVEDTCREFGWKLNVVEPAPHETYEIFVKRFGFPHHSQHSAVMGFLKWHPIRRFAAKHKHENIVFVTGRRKKESKRRMLKVKNQYETPEKNITFYQSLMDWSTPTVWQYIKDNGLKKCPVYETLHMSGDCLCGAFSELGEAEMITTFHPYMAERIRNLEERYEKEEWAKKSLQGIDKRTKLARQVLCSRTRGKWGNQTSMSNATFQTKIDQLICTDCMYS